MAPLVQPEQLEAIVRLSRGEALDRTSRAGLERATEEFLGHRGPHVSRIALEIDGSGAASLFAALVDPGRSFDSIVLRLTEPVAEEESWEYLRPFRELRITTGGAGEVIRPDGGTERAMVRIALREYFTPFSSSREGPSARPRLFAPTEFVSFVRTTGTVPFAIALEVYCTDERIRYEIDLLDNALLSDPRAGRFRLESRLRRSPRFSYAVDSIVARGDLSIPAIRAFETIVESRGLTPTDLAPMFSGVHELGRSALTALVERRLVLLDRRTGVYRAKIEAIAGSGERRRPTAADLKPLGDPQLRTSVAELLAAADSQARCPLCGGPMPATSTELVCPDCLERVNRAGAKAAE